MKKAIIVGSGAGGATAAKELQGHYDVTILEAGKEFRPFPANLALVEMIKKTGLLMDEREIQLLFPAMKIRKTADRMVMVNGVGLGGTTTLATGNGIQIDRDLQELGINLAAEFEELRKEIPISTDHQSRWRPTTRRLFEACRELGMNPVPLPKMGNYRKCINCGKCVLGCASGAKWDSRQFLNQAVAKGAAVHTRCRVRELLIAGGKAVGVKLQKGVRTHSLRADLVILAAGGFETPVILENSGIACEQRLFVDPVLCVAAEQKNALQNKELSMPFVVQRSGYILSPYFDYLSFFFNRDWRFAARDTMSMMIKLADTSLGAVAGGRIDKTLTGEDRAGLHEGVQRCQEIFAHLGVPPEKTVLGTINAGHPGGMVPLTAGDAATMHPQRLPENLYVADASLFPSSLGNPPILTIMAMAKRISTICKQN